MDEGRPPLANPILDDVDGVVGQFADRNVLKDVASFQSKAAVGQPSRVNL